MCKDHWIGVQNKMKIWRTNNGAAFFLKIFLYPLKSNIKNEILLMVLRKFFNKNTDSNFIILYLMKSYLINERPKCRSLNN
jgi:hypothetical protein